MRTTINDIARWFPSKLPTKKFELMPTCMQRMYPIGKVLDEANARIHPSNHPSPIVVGATGNAKRNGEKCEWMRHSFTYKLDMSSTIIVPRKMTMNTHTKWAVRQIMIFSWMYLHRCATKMFHVFCATYQFHVSMVWREQHALASATCTIQHFFPLIPCNAKCNMTFDYNLN